MKEEGDKEEGRSKKQEQNNLYFHNIKYNDKDDNYLFRRD